MAHTQSNGDLPRNGAHPVRHEARDVSLSALLKFAIGLALLTAVAQLVVWLMMGAFESRAASEPAQYPLAAGEERVPPAQRLQSEPREDFKAYEQRQQELLNSYHWIDANTGVVGIPIETAMKQVLEQGLPVRASGAGVERRDTERQGR